RERGRIGPDRSGAAERTAEESGSQSCGDQEAKTTLGVTLRLEHGGSVRLDCTGFEAPVVRRAAAYQTARAPQQDSHRGSPAGRASEYQAVADAIHRRNARCRVRTTSATTRNFQVQSSDPSARVASHAPPRSDVWHHGSARRRTRPDRLWEAFDVS